MILSDERYLKITEKDLLLTKDENLKKIRLSYENRGSLNIFKENFGMEDFLNSILSVFLDLLDKDLVNGCVRFYFKIKDKDIHCAINGERILSSINIKEFCLYPICKTLSVSLMRMHLNKDDININVGDVVSVYIKYEDKI